MKKYYPVRRNQNFDRNVPSINQRTLMNFADLIPTKTGNDRDVAVSVSTHIHLKNRAGEEVDIYRNQNMLDLNKNARGRWEAGGSANNQYTRERRWKDVY